ncbi:AmmeMemoRadiSam system protein A [Phytomonospora sp. NPDC050363]|uniref:AmmeMemoRadiSam system protein A n=1 Tax=Phytomonospora sp. NPDC050363 TaxID=3155642 RepID=UPI0033C8BB47
MPPMEAFGEAVTRLAVEAVRLTMAVATVAPDELLLDDDPERLREPGASFVTLEHGGRLRGCIGTLQAQRPLYVDVPRNAARAMSDPRLPPVEPAEWPGLTVKVSVLTTPEPLDADPRALLAALRPGVDGIILSDGTRRSTFLPAVWKRLETPQAFLAALLRKGGWPRWPEEGMTVSRYESLEYVSTPPPGGRT